MHENDAAAEPDTLKQDLLDFFQALKREGLIRTVVGDFGDELAGLVESHGYRPRGGKQADKKLFKHFEVAQAEHCPSGRKLCRTVIDVLPRLKLDGPAYHHIKRIYERHFDQPFDVLAAATGYRLFRPSQATPEEQSNLHLDGDFLMLRIERRNRNDKPELTVSRNFLRFFEHRPEGRRFMMLSLYGKNRSRFLGAKGWVDNLGKSFLCSGQIINRESPEFADEHVYGGMTTLAIDTGDVPRFVMTRSELDGGKKGVSLEGAPVLHMRAVHGQPPSIARGYMVRCFGLEHLGGGPYQSSEARFQRIRELQDLLQSLFPEELQMMGAADELSKATGLQAREFYDDMKDKTWPSGLLVNLPFTGRSTTGTKAGPLEFPTEKFGMPNWGIKSTIRRGSKPVGIDLTKQVSPAL